MLECCSLDPTARPSAQTVADRLAAMLCTIDTSGGA